MPPPVLHVLLFLLLLLLSHPPPTNAIPNSDLQSLLDFKRGILSDPSNHLSSWTPPPTPLPCPSHFRGIACDPSGTSVVSISLKGLNLSGVIDFQTLSAIRSLQILDLSSNNLTGIISPSIGELHSLQYLDLSSNRFYGSLPERITELSGLNYLNISFNDFTRGLPRGLWRLQQLRFLDLTRNMHWGDVGVVLSELRNTEVVSLSGNRFYGQLNMPAANLSGFAGTVKYLNLSHNKLAGRFFNAESMSTLRNLAVLDVSYNRLVGELPGFAFQSNLRVFWGRCNNFSGELPVGLFSSSVPLVDLDLSRNMFAGPLKDINSTTLQILKLSSNALLGPLPSSIGNCIVLELNDNWISGNLSAINSWGTFVKFVDLSSNNLSGNFPNLTSPLVALTYINIRYNSLQGALPSTFGSCRNLSAVDLSMNRLEGPLPPSLLTLTNLMYLNLSGNMFSGNISLKKPISFDPLVASTYLQLKLLDLSYNNLSGPLPSDIVALQNLQLLNLRNNSISGKLPVEIGNLSALRFLDISFNDFNGKIPDISQPSLKLLNVSYNNLSGLVPQSLRRFPDACFHPGNALLGFFNASQRGCPPMPPRSPTPYNYTGVIDDSGRVNGRSGSGIRLAVIVGCIGAILLLLFTVMTVYRIGNQETCEEKGFRGETHGRDLMLGRFTPRLWSHKTTHRTASMSFSNDHLLQSTQGSARKELISIALEHDYSDAQDVNEVGSTLVDISLSESCHSMGECKSSSSTMLASPSLIRGQNASEQPVVMEVQPDKLLGELFFLDNSVVFSAEDMSRAPAEVLGRSCHGASYKATLNNGHTLTVKWLRVGLAKKKKEFAKEVKKIGTIKHPNIISLRAYYWGTREQERLIISDYVNGDSLAEYLYGSTSKERLSLSQRLNIAVDVARCLCFLHLDKGLPHGNLKPMNILLSGLHLTAQLTDYGLHRLMTPNCAAEQMMNLVALGYGAPELTPAVAGQATKPVPSFKADIYAFGIILIELLTGKSASDIVLGQSGAVDLTDWVQMCAQEGRETECYERGIPGSEESQGAMDAILAIALRCILNVDERPSVKAVFDDLCSVTL